MAIDCDIGGTDPVGRRVDPESLPAPGTRRIYLARHGQTDDNVEPRKFQGRRDVSLNAHGRQQASRLAEKLEQGSYGPAALYSSDLSRARETAETVGRTLGLSVVVDPRLSEGFRGRWEGRYMRDVAAEEPELYKQWLQASSTFRFPGGESLLEHRSRALWALADAARGPVPALVIAHGGTIRMILAALEGLPMESFHTYHLDNCELVALDIEDRAQAGAGVG